MRRFRCSFWVASAFFVLLPLSFGFIVALLSRSPHPFIVLTSRISPHSSDVSRTSTISISAYLRTAQCVQGQDDMGNDLLMARVDLTPALDAHVRLCVTFALFGCF